MDDASFSALAVEASIAPQSADWPNPDFSGTTIQGDKPHVPAGELHWDALHTCVAVARKKTLRTLGAFAGIDASRSLSVDGKREEKKKAGQAALSDMEKSQALANARAAVERQVAKCDKELAPPVIDSTVAAEIRAHVAGLRDGERLVFVTKNISDAGPAILGAPAFLSRLTPAEQDIVRRQYATLRNPEAAAAKRKAMDALAHCEQGWRNASNQIRSRAGLKDASNGGAA